VAGPTDLVPLVLNYYKLTDELVKKRRRGRTRIESETVTPIEPQPVAPSDVDTYPEPQVDTTVRREGLARGQVENRDLFGGPITAELPRADQLFDYIRIAKEVAVESGNNQVADRLEQAASETAKQVSEGEAMSRYGEYTGALMGLTSGSALLGDVVNDINKDPDQSSPGIIERITGALRTVGQVVERALSSIFFRVKEEIQGLSHFSESLKSLINGFAEKAKDKILEGLRNVFHDLGTLAAKVVSALLGWAASVKRLARERGFTLKTFTITIPSSSWQTVSAFGFSIPIPTISSPEVAIEFT
jgi:hypothetical protein